MGIYERSYMRASSPEPPGKISTKLKGAGISIAVFLIVAKLSPKPIVISLGIVMGCVFAGATLEQRTYHHKRLVACLLSIPASLAAVALTLFIASINWAFMSDHVASLGSGVVIYERFLNRFTWTGIVLVLICSAAVAWQGIEMEVLTAEFVGVTLSLFTVAYTIGKVCYRAGLW